MSNDLERFRGSMAGRVIDRRCPECGASIGLAQTKCNACLTKEEEADGNTDTN